nr:PQQ-like beta-propeller repeat protein [Methanoculleus bourgensis]
MLCLIAGTGQAYSSDNATGTASQGVQIRTELYLYPEAGNSVSQGDSGGGGGLSAILLWTHTFPDAVTAISMPTDGSAVAVGTAGGEIALLNSSGSVLWTYQSDAPITGLGITTGGSAIAAGTGNRIMMLDAGGRFSGRWIQEAGCLGPASPLKGSTAPPGPPQGISSSLTAGEAFSGRRNREAPSPPSRSALMVRSWRQEPKTDPSIS